MMEGDPELLLLEPPEKGFRFRYKSELSGSHGKLKGLHSKKNKVTYPTVKLENTKDTGIILQCSLATEDKQPHVHKLYGLNCDSSGVCRIVLCPDKDMTHNFQGLVIQYEAKKNMKLISGKTEKVHERRQDDKYMNMNCDLNKAILCFQAFKIINGVEVEICPPIYSDVIKNLKNPQTGDLRICRISAYSGVCTGNEEVWILVEKVRKDDIQIIFFESIDDQIIWSQEAYFNQSDVHHQYAIVFRTPEYKSTQLTEPVKVKMCLRRPLDNATSNVIDFMYIPKPRSYKRPIPSNSSNSESSGLLTKKPTLMSTQPVENFTNTVDTLNNTTQLSQYSDEVPYSDIIGTPEIISIISGLEDRDPFSFLNLNQNSLPTENGSTEASHISFDSLLIEGSAAKHSNSQLFDSMDMGHQFNTYRDTSEGSPCPCPSVYSITGSCMSPNSPESVTSNIECNQLLSPNFQNSGGDAQSSYYDAFKLLDREHLFYCDDVVIDGSDANITEGIEKLSLNPDDLSTQVHEISEAIQEGNLKTVWCLLQSGKDPTLLDADGNNAFHLAAVCPSSAYLNMLFTKLTNPVCGLNILNYDGFSPLHLATLCNLKENVKLIASQRCNVNLTDGKRGFTALHYAIDEKNGDISKTLLEAGASMTVTGFNGDSPRSILTKQTKEPDV